MSENIFAEIYNKILGLFGQNTKDESKNTAVNRLRLVLMQDRTNLTPEIMNRMRTELIAVLSKYVELDKEALDLNIGQEGEQMALMLSIPVIRAKDEAEIEEALKKETEKANEESEDAEAEEKEENNENSESEATDEETEEKQISEDSETSEQGEESNDSEEKNKEVDTSEDEPTSEPAESAIDEKQIPKIKKVQKNDSEEE